MEALIFNLSDGRRMEIQKVTSNAAAIRFIESNGEGGATVTADWLAAAIEGTIRRDPDGFVKAQESRDIEAIVRSVTEAHGRRNERTGDERDAQNAGNVRVQRGG